MFTPPSINRLQEEYYINYPYKSTKNIFVCINMFCCT